MNIPDAPVWNPIELQIKNKILWVWFWLLPNYINVSLSETSKSKFEFWLKNLNVVCCTYFRSLVKISAWLEHWKVFLRRRGRRFLACWGKRLYFLVSRIIIQTNYIWYWEKALIILQLIVPFTLRNKTDFWRYKTFYSRGVDLPPFAV